MGTIQTRVQTRTGSLIGSADTVRVFLGVPYAQAPIGELRWRPPQPLVPWSGDRIADRFGNDFPQVGNPMMRAPAQDDDCLYLNIWAPAEGVLAPAESLLAHAEDRVAVNGGLPVMVWLHGGGFVSGSGSDVRCDGAALAQSGVVVVSLNYRSGVFGFLAHPALSAESPDRVSGNYGLLDQLAALRWVQENIAAFGGSPERVTLFGVSAGSASIALLLTSPLARGLFRQAILHSPGTCRPLASLADAERAGQLLGDDIAVLRRLSAAQLFEKTPMLVPRMRGLTTPRVLRPICDGHVIPQNELSAFDRGDFLAMPILLGTNLDEGSKLTASWTIDTMAQYRALLQTSFGTAAGEAFEIYPAENDDQVRPRVSELFGDTQFNYGTWRLAQAMSSRGQPTYRYLFSRRRSGQRDGPHHGDEVAYPFNNLEAQGACAGIEFNANDRRVAAAMHAAWLSFAITADPNGPALPCWPKVSSSAAPCMVFDDRIAVRAGWREREMAFIDRYSHEPERPA